MHSIRIESPFRLEMVTIISAPFCLLVKCFKNKCIANVLLVHVLVHVLIAHVLYMLISVISITLGTCAISDLLIWLGETQ